MATEPDAVNTGALGTLIAVGVFTMVGTCLVVNALVRTETAENAALKATDANLELRGVQKKQQTILSTGAGIDRQMKGVLEQLKRDPESASPAPPAKPTAVEGDAGSAAAGDAANPAASASAAPAPAEEAAPSKPAPKSEMPRGAERGKPKPPRNPGSPNPHRAPGG